MEKVNYKIKKYKLKNININGYEIKKRYSFLFFSFWLTEYELVDENIRKPLIYADLTTAENKLKELNNK